jgi:cobalt-zinc-cadmium resistance protein CzcA
VQQGEARYDVTLRYQKQYRDTREAIEDVTPAGAFGRTCFAGATDEKSPPTTAQSRSIAREASATSPSSTPSADATWVQPSKRPSARWTQCKLPSGYHLEWAGEYASQKRADKRMALVIPITVLVIFLILYTMFRSYKWSILVLVSVIMASIGGPLALFLTHTNFSVSSAVGFLALFGVSVETGVIMIEFINQLRARRKGSEEFSEEGVIEAAVEGSVQRLRPIMMTMLVATLGLLPAALSHAIGSDSQRPFAIVIVGGLIANLVIGVFLMPTLYVWMARENDVLPETDVNKDS